MGLLIQEATKFQMRRFFRKRHRETTNTFSKILDNFDKYFTSRLSSLLQAKRFTLSYLILAILLLATTSYQILNLGKTYQSLMPISGGAYHEGIVGTFSTVNPLFASGSVDLTLSRLLFSGLLKYDDNNSLVPDLASEYSVDETGKIYIFKLRHSLKWHDGKELTAEDVVYTFQAMQNQDTKSNLQSAMAGVSISSTDKYTIRFALESPLSSFPASLTVGIIPKHILGEKELGELRTDPFNSSRPVGCGPFKWRQLKINTIGEDQNVTSIISLDRFDDYHNSRPQINRFVLHTYTSTDDLIKAYKKREVRSMTGLKSLPKELDTEVDTSIYDFRTTAITMAFFNLESSTPISDITIRKAIMQGTNREQIIKSLGQTLHTAREPFLENQFAYDPQYEQPQYDEKRAIDTLESAGWKADKNGVRVKDGKKLFFRFYAQDSADNQIITKELKTQWKKLGIDVDIILQQTIDFQTTLLARSYDAALNSISIGTDPDVYPYWHSSQANSNGMNFSNYKSSTADNSLEAGRTRQDQAQRSLKYKPFLKSWSEDVPALALFTPRIYYVTRGTVYGLNEYTINTDADRYFSINQWMINTGWVNNR